jgi:hypothetical protein
MEANADAAMVRGSALRAEHLTMTLVGVKP